MSSIAEPPPEASPAGESIPSYNVEYPERGKTNLARAPFSQARAACLAAARTGDASTFYRMFGAALRRQANYADYLKSDVWQEKRRQVLERAKGRCERCGVANVMFEIHHVRYTPWGEETLEDLLALCAPCHGEMEE